MHHIDVSIRVRPSAAASTLSIAKAGIEVLGSQQPPFTYAANILSGSDQSCAFDALAAPLLAKLDSGFGRIRAVLRLQEQSAQEQRRVVADTAHRLCE